MSIEKAVQKAEQPAPRRNAEPSAVDDVLGGYAPLAVMVLALLFLSLLMMPLGMANQDLGRVVALRSLTRQEHASDPASDHAAALGQGDEVLGGHAAPGSLRSSRGTARIPRRL